MSRQMESGALALLNEILQLGGGGDQTTTLDDGNVSQVLGIENIVRRSLTFANTTGVFWFGLANNHTVDGVLTSSVDPYSSDPGINTFPTEMPRGFDAWLLYASMKHFAGAGSFTGATLELVLTAAMQGKGTTVTSVVPLGLWDSTEALSGQNYGITEGGETLIRPIVRLRRGSLIQFRSNGVAPITLNMIALVAAFPAGLGQDVVG